MSFMFFYVCCIFAYYLSLVIIVIIDYRKYGKLGITVGEALTTIAVGLIPLFNIVVLLYGIWFAFYNINKDFFNKRL